MKFSKILLVGVVGFLVASMAPKCFGQQQQQSALEIENAVLAAQLQAPNQQHQEESYQQVYDAFTKLMSNVSNNSIGSVRRLVSRLNQLVGAQPQTQTVAQIPPAAASAMDRRPQSSQCDQVIDERTEQILTRLDSVNRNTDQHTLNQLNDDVGKLVNTLNSSYLRNIRRVIERVNKVVGQPQSGANRDQPMAEAASRLHQQGDRLDDVNNRVPGFPGWDELMVAMDRMQKSLAHFVRSSTRLITSG